MWSSGAIQRFSHARTFEVVSIGRIADPLPEVDWTRRNVMLLDIDTNTVTVLELFVCDATLTQVVAFCVCAVLRTLITDQ